MSGVRGVEFVVVISSGDPLTGASQLRDWLRLRACRRCRRPRRRRVSSHVDLFVVQSVLLLASVLLACILLRHDEG
jgi:hypothetical protein